MPAQRPGERATRVTSRLLGVDLGTRRIGLAVADAAVGIARPLATVARAATVEADAAVLRRVCDEQHVDEVIVGLPLEASGEAGPMADAARVWGEGIQALLGRPVRMRDERLTSFEAERRLGPMKRGRSGGPPSRVRRNAHRARVDREAASVILQDELDARAAASGSGQAGPIADPRTPPR